MKFRKEFASQMVPEWQEAYMNYDQLKILLKEIQHMKHPVDSNTKDIKNQEILAISVEQNGSESYEAMFPKAAEEGGEFELVFFKRLCDEFNKVDRFYRSKEQDVMDEAVMLSKQMEALFSFRLQVRNQQVLSKGPLADLNSLASDKPTRTLSAGGSNRITPGLICLELDHEDLNTSHETPSLTIKGFPEPKVSRKNMKKAEKQLKLAFTEFYHKLRLLRNYRNLNIRAFSKIVKKYEKISSRRTLETYMNMVDNSYLGSSDEITKLMEGVEETFTKNFCSSDRSKAMDALRPKPKKERHRISFTIGLFVGCTLAIILALLAISHKNLRNRKGKHHYEENMIYLYSLFGFLVLHMLTYAANIYFWRRYRVNYSFIFGFKRGTALGHQEVLMLGFGLAVLLLAGVLANLDMEINPKTDYKALSTELIPLSLVVLVLIVFLCPLNIIYRSSRFFLITCLFHCIFAPMFKVSFQDSFLADQLTSQVQALRSLEFYICYYGWGEYKLNQNTCQTNDVYNTFYFIVAVIPFCSRLLQCLRRLYEEKDKMQAYNGLKYFCTIVAVCTRTAYHLNEGLGWEILASIFSVIAAVYCIYWDIVMDWGLLQSHSKNWFLRDKLLIPHKSVYFGVMVLNVLLRFAWLQTVFHFQVPYLNRQSLIAMVASLEIIRRGIWSFFRLENEHLQNVSKFRAFKSVPLPFEYNVRQDKHELVIASE